jgi:hypothetical protein
MSAVKMKDAATCAHSSADSSGTLDRLIVSKPP